MEPVEKNEFLSDLEQLDSGQMEIKVSVPRDKLHPAREHK